MRKEESGKRRVRQGRKRQYCLDDLLETLLNEPLGFNAIVEKINEDKFAGAILSPSYSKGTIIKYLRDAIKDELVEYIDIERKGVGENRRPIGLTPKGKKRAERNRITTALTVLSDVEFKRFVLNYKLYIVREIVNYFDDLSSGSGYPVPSRNLDDDAEVEGLVNQIEADLRYHSFKEDEIVRLWLIDRGYPVLDVIKRLGAPHLHNGDTSTRPTYTPQEEELIKQIKAKLGINSS
jgi:hypothetical protein